MESRWSPRAPSARVRRPCTSAEDAPRTLTSGHPPLRACAALLFLAAYAAQIIARPSGFIAAVTEGIIWISWGVFVVDYVVRISIPHEVLDLLALVHRGAGNVLRGRVAIYTVGAAGLLLLVSALAVLDAEEGQGTIDTFGQAIWWAFVTMTTVGYGDFTPVTVVGRCVAGD